MRIPSFSMATLAVSGPATGNVAKRGDGDGSTIWATPHDSYSSSIGVLGCKINTDRVAYWPQPVDCDNICVQVEYEDRRVYLLRIDQSEGAHDMSYDAWNYLYTGHSATDKPTAGGAVEMKYRNVAASKCRALIYTEGGKLPLSAANSMNFIASCLQQSRSWVANNYMALNIADSLCTLGVDEQCKLDWPEANQPTCPHTLGQLGTLRGDPVYNVQYPSGKRVLAISGAPGAGSVGGGDESAASSRLARQSAGLLLGIWTIICFHVLS